MSTITHCSEKQCLDKRGTVKYNNTGFSQQQRQDYHDNIRTSVRKRLPPQASEAALLLLRTGLWEKTVGNDTVYDSKTKNLEKVQMTGSETLDVCVEKFNQFRSGAHMRYRAKYDVM